MQTLLKRSPEYVNHRIEYINHLFSFSWTKTAEPLSLPLTLYLYYTILFAVCQGVFWNFSKYFFSRCLSVYYYVQIPRFGNFRLPLNLPLLYHRFEILSRGFLKFSEKIFDRCLRVYNIMNAPAFSDLQRPWREPLAFDTLIITYLWEFVKTFLRIFEKYFLTLTVNAVPRV